MLVIEANEYELDLVEKAPPNDSLSWQDVLEVLAVSFKCLLEETLSKRVVSEDQLEREPVRLLVVLHLEGKDRLCIGQAIAGHLFLEDYLTGKWHEGKGGPQVLTIVEAIGGEGCQSLH